MIPVLTYYTVKFVSEGTTLSTQQVLSGTTVAAPAEEPTTTADCKAFGGWYVNGAAYDFAAAVTGDLTITAQWNDAHTYVAEEIKAADDETVVVAKQEVCSVCEDKKDAVLTGQAVAQVGENYYVDVAEAVKAANGETVTLLKSAATTSKIDVATELVIDLNGYTLEGTTTLFNIMTGGSLTASNGTLKRTAVSTSGGYGFEPTILLNANQTGTVNLSDCTVENTGENNSYGTAAALASNGLGTLNLTATNTNFITVGSMAVYLPDPGVHTLTNCTASAKYTAVVACGGDLTITGGTYYGKTGFDIFYGEDTDYYLRARNSDGGVCTSEAIVIMDRRSPGYTLKSVSITGATITVDTSTKLNGPCAYGIRICDLNNKADSEAITPIIANNNYTNVDANGHGGYVYYSYSNP